MIQLPQDKIVPIAMLVRQPTQSNLNSGISNFMQRIATASLLAILSLIGIQARASADDKLPVLLNEDFEHGFSRWQTTDPKGADPVWKIIEVGPKGNHALRVTGKSKYKPPF